MNIFEAYNKTKKELESAGIEDYVFEAKQIIFKFGNSYELHKSAYRISKQ